MAVKDNKKETDVGKANEKNLSDLESGSSSSEEHHESKQPEVDRSGNIVCRIFRKHCLAIKNLHHNFTRSNEKKDAPKMTRNEKLVEACLAPIFLPFYILLFALVFGIALPVTIIVIVFGCLTCCCCCNSDLSSTLIIWCLAITLVSLLILVVCIFALVFWPIFVVYYAITACVYGGDAIV